MKTLAMIAFAAGLLVSSVTANAETVLYADQGLYRIYKGQENRNCSMIGMLSKDFAVSILFNPFTDMAFLYATAGEGANFAPGSTLKLNIFLFKPDGKLDEGWGVRDFSVTADPDAMPNTRAFSTTFSGEQFLDDVGSSEYIALAIGDKRIVYAWRLKGSKAAVASLRECAYSLTP